MFGYKKLRYIKGFSLLVIVPLIFLLPFVSRSGAKTALLVVIATLPFSIVWEFLSSKRDSLGKNWIWDFNGQNLLCKFKEFPFDELLFMTIGTFTMMAFWIVIKTYQVSHMYLLLGWIFLVFFAYATRRFWYH